MPPQHAGLLFVTPDRSDISTPETEKMIKNIFLLFLSLILSPPFLTAQEAVIQGTVSWEEEALAGGNVIIVNSNTGTVTNREGRFESADLPPGDHLIQISYIGYGTVEFSVSLTAGETKVLEVDLEDPFPNQHFSSVAVPALTIPSGWVETDWFL